MKVSEITKVTGAFTLVRPRGAVIEVNQDKNIAEGNRLICGDCNNGVFSFWSPQWDHHEFAIQCVSCKAVYFRDRRYWIFLANAE
ncbi:MAG: hypothetical protein HYT65_01680 [Candidatus Yanofskybacteria bacterium]|nr:hypothetical protein [Candidatus Yanofskybacteria bacterium]